MRLRLEAPDDAARIAELTLAAFTGMPHSDLTEPAIVEGLRAAGALTLSLVMEDENGVLVGHAAFSPVEIIPRRENWFGLGPVSVEPARQRTGIGQRLIREGLDRLKNMGARGCVVFGDPRYYGRFGFIASPGLRYADDPGGYFQALSFAGDLPRGEVSYHPAFDSPPDGQAA